MTPLEPSPRGRPRVSVLVAVRDRESLVQETIRSVVSQDYDDLECVVVDDASTDRSAEAAASVPGPVHVIRREVQGGPSAAFNTGLARARGEWIALIGSDDVWLPGSLAARMEAVASESRAVLVCSDASLWDGRRILAERMLGSPPLLPGDDPFARLLRGNCILALTAVIRAEPLRRVGGFVESFHRCEDYQLWLRLARLGPFVFLDRPLALYRVHGGQLSADDEGMFRAEVAALESLVEDPGLHLSAAEAAAVRRRIRDLHVERGYEDLVAGRRRAARDKLLGALASKPWEPRLVGYLAATFLPPGAVRAVRRWRGRDG